MVNMDFSSGKHSSEDVAAEESVPRKNEAEVDARIAKIRARNEALLKRRAEVEADRKLAEESRAAVSTKIQVKISGMVCFS